MLLPITCTMAGAATLLNLWLAGRCVQSRYRTRTNMGDGGDPQLQARMRAQANFVEYSPFFLILLGLIEYARGPQTWLWVVGIVYILGRLAHPLGLERPAPNALRAGGILATFVSLIVLAGYALYLPYAAR